VECTPDSFPLSHFPSAAQIRRAREKKYEVSVKMPRSTTLAAVAGAMLGVASARTGPAPGDVLILEDDFTNFNLTLWKHELTLVRRACVYARAN
jgi:hypothetical protein